MLKVSTMKYLGFILSEDGSNSPNILDLKNKSMGTIREILSLIKGSGQFYFECSLIYKNSLLRSKILYGCETYYHLSDTCIGLLEDIELSLIKQTLNSTQNGGKHLLWLEMGQVPTRYIIQEYKLNYLQYILKQNKKSLMYKFFIYSAKT